MTIAEMVNRMATLLRAELSAPVEQYWRLEPPTQATVYVQPKQESEESRGIGNVWVDVLAVDIICETPWDDTVATAEALVAIVEQVKALIETNRDLYDQAGALMAQRGSIESVRWQFMQRPGAGHPCFGGIVGVTYRPGK